jgi:hypothetical protein
MVINESLLEEQERLNRQFPNVTIDYGALPPDNTIPLADLPLISETIDMKGLRREFKSNAASGLFPETKEEYILEIGRIEKEAGELFDRHESFIKDLDGTSPEAKDNLARYRAVNKRWEELQDLAEKSGWPPPWDLLGTDSSIQPSSLSATSPPSSISAPPPALERSPETSSTNTPFGASQTDLNAISPNLGALNPTQLDLIMRTVKQHMGTRPEVDPWLTSLQFFANMAAAASKPGATAIGAAGTAGATTVQTLLEERKAKRAEELAATKMGLSLATTLGKPKPTKAYMNQTTKKIEYFTVSEFNALTNKGKYIPYKAPGAGSDKERFMNTVIELGPKIKAGTATAAEKSRYSIVYQELTKGFTTTTYDDQGNQQTIRVPGIDLTNLGTNIPSPEGFDAKKILSSKSREWGPLGTNATFAQRMLYMEVIVRDVLEGGYKLNIRDVTADNMPAFIGTTLVSAAGQRFYAASRNFIAAVLRKESGAAISDGEYLNGLKQYFPQVGNTAEVMQDKAALRSAAIEGMVKESGDAFASIYPSAIPFLTFKVGKKVHNVINPRGYSSFELAKAKLGRSLYFDDSILAMSIVELRGMLARTDADKIYTNDQLNKISKRIDELENQQ